MLEVANLIHGAVLSRHDGIETHEGLKIQICGLARAADRVTVNGVEAERCGEDFSAHLLLNRRFNPIRIESEGDRGRRKLELEVVWDKASFRRVNFCIDDNIFALSEIARDRPKSLFDHFYLKGLRKLHEKYGLKVTLNLFYHNDHFPFDLSGFPDCWRSEWQDNADWLRLAFHAYSEFPDRPYQNAAPGKLGADYDLVANEIRRFAGERTLIPPVNFHWAMAPEDSIAELRERGVTYLGGSYLSARTRIGETAGSIPESDIGYFQSDENGFYITRKHVRWDARFGLLFGVDDVICNLEPMPELRRLMHALCARKTNDFLSVITHEQYFFPFYANYLPDHFARIEEMAKIVTEAGYKFVFTSEGFLGNPAEP